MMMEFAWIPFTSWAAESLLKQTGYEFLSYNNAVSVFSANWLVTIQFVILFLVNLFNEAGAKFGLPTGAVQLVESAEREVVAQMAKMSEYIDVLIPRGGKSLKDFIAQNATVPIIMTGAGVCHIFVDESANLKQTAKIIKNAKTQRPSVCNAVECVLLHERIAGKILPELVREMPEVEFRVSEQLIGACGHLHQDVLGCHPKRVLVLPDHASFADEVDEAV